MDRPKRQTATATPAKPGGLPLTLVFAESGPFPNSFSKTGLMTAISMLRYVPRSRGVEALSPTELGDKMPSRLFLASAARLTAS